MELDELNEKTTELIRKHDKATRLANKHSENREKYWKEYEELKAQACAEGFVYDFSSKNLQWKMKEK
jgi:hypothetical protein